MLHASFILLCLVGCTLSDYQQAALDLHNMFRAVHGSQPMTLNQEMSAQAAQYAQKLAQIGQLAHALKEERNGQGESLSMGCSTIKGQTVTEAVNNWYNEVCDPGYDFSVGMGQSGAGHFTQLVWNASTELGIGKADVTMPMGLKCAYFVARYKPAGNMLEYKKNVKKGSFDSQAHCSAIFKKSSTHKRKIPNVNNKEAFKTPLGPIKHP